jgi:hypothetical protein
MTYRNRDEMITLKTLSSVNSGFILGTFDGVVKGDDMGITHCKMSMKCMTTATQIMSKHRPTDMNIHWNVHSASKVLCDVSSTLGYLWHLVSSYSL